MENTATVFDYSARNFLEQMMGFDKPLEGSTLASLFKGNDNVRYYTSRATNATASLNAVNKHQFQAQHYRTANEGSHPVLFDVMTNPIQRVYEFLDGELAKQGLKLLEVLNQTQGNLFYQVTHLVKEFYKNYCKHIDAKAEMLSSLTLIKSSNANNWDMLVRIGFFARDENMYVEFPFRKIITNVTILLHEEQAREAANAVRTFVAKFGGLATLFGELPNLEFSESVVHTVVHERDIAAEKFYHGYSNAVRINAPHYKNIEHQAIAGMVVDWGSVTKEQRIILQAALDIARVHVNAHIAVNTTLAQNK